jgi:hypothetical protein
MIKKIGCATDDYSTKTCKNISNSVDHLYVDRAILNTVFENTDRHVNKCLETGGGHHEHYT